MFNASWGNLPDRENDPIEPPSCCRASFALNFYLSEFWCNWLFVNNAAMKLDSAGSGEWALDLFYLLWHLLSSWWSGQWVVWPVCPLSLTVVDTEPGRIIKAPTIRVVIFIITVKQSLQQRPPPKKTITAIKLMIKVYPVSCIKWGLGGGSKWI